MPPSSKRKKPVSKVRTPKKKKDIFDDPEEVLISSDSPLYQDNTSIKYILQHPLAIATLADSKMDYQLDSLSPQELDTRATEVKRDGGAGCYDPQWIREALIASSERSSGIYDEYLQAKFDEYWAEGDGREEVESDDEETGGSKPNEGKAVNGNEVDSFPKPRDDTEEYQRMEAQAQNHAALQDKVQSHLQHANATRLNELVPLSTATPFTRSLNTDSGAPKDQTTPDPSEITAGAPSKPPTAKKPQDITTARDFPICSSETEDAKIGDGTPDQDQAMDEPCNITTDVLSVAPTTTLQEHANAPHHD